MYITSNYTLKHLELKNQPLCYISVHIWQAALMFNVNADNDANKRPTDLSYKDDIYDIVYASMPTDMFNRTGLIAYI